MQPGAANPGFAARDDLPGFARSLATIRLAQLLLDDVFMSKPDEDSALVLGYAFGQPADRCKSYSAQIELTQDEFGDIRNRVIGRRGQEPRTSDTEIEMLCAGPGALQARHADDVPRASSRGATISAAVKSVDVDGFLTGTRVGLARDASTLAEDLHGNREGRGDVDPGPLLGTVQLREKGE